MCVRVSARVRLAIDSPRLYLRIPQQTGVRVYQRIAGQVEACAFGELTWERADEGLVTVVALHAALLLVELLK